MSLSIKAALSVAIIALCGTVAAQAQPFYPDNPGPVNEVGPANEGGTRTTTTTTVTRTYRPIHRTTVVTGPEALPGTTTPVEAVFLRAGPSTGAPVIGTLQPGMPLHVMSGASGGWRQVNSPVGSGWAYGSYLAPG